MTRGLVVVAYLAALVVWSAVVGIPNDPLGILLWGWLALLIAHRHEGFWRDWRPYVVALVAYWFFRGLADETFLDVHFDYTVRFDRWLGGLVGDGRTPTEQLQDAWCGVPCLRSGDPRWWDLVLNTVYASHFYVAMLLGLALWVRNKDAWRAWMRRYVTLLFVGLTGYFLVPTAPPWMGIDAARITSRAWGELGLERQNMILLGMPNRVAAMPSLHTGIAALVALYAVSRLRSPWRWVLLLYPVAMGLALCYFGEHYVVDEIAGVAAAGAVMAGWAWWDRRSRTSSVEHVETSPVDAAG
ncbi:phosphatase PAP2 family protein [Nocardioides dilutus]